MLCATAPSTPQVFSRTTWSVELKMRLLKLKQNAVPPSPDRAMAGMVRKSNTGFQLCRLPVRFGSRSSKTHPGEVGSSELQNQFCPIQDQLFSEATHVLDRPSHSNREAGAIRASTHETHSVAPEEPLAYLSRWRRSFRFPGPFILTYFGG